MDKVRIGIVGCGNISGNYLHNARKFPILEVVALADQLLDRAQARAKEFNVPKAYTVEQMMADPSIQIIVNLTIPKAHAEVAIMACNAGKHVISEKPFAVTREEGRAILAAAKKNNVRTGGAPDTFLGAGHQLARKLIDDGAIGRPVAATAYMMGRGHESWHPDPEFYYKAGGGPMFDMGPYYITDLLQLLGPINRVTGATSIAIPERTITHGNGKGGQGPKFGQKITVETPDHLAGTLEFANGCIGTVIMSFAVIGSHASNPQPITIYGTEGTLLVPDPNGFDGVVKLMRHGEPDFHTVRPVHTAGYGRSVGVADLAYALRSGRDHRVSGERAYVVLDVMSAFLDAGREGKAINIEPGYTRPAALPPGLPEGELDA